MRSKVALLLAGVAGVLIGSIAVYTLRADPFPVQVLTTGLASGETVLDLKESPPVPPVNEQTKEPDSNVRVQTLHDVARLESDFDQRYALYQLISYAEEDELEKYISQSADISSKNQRMVALTMIFTRYAVLDPHEALSRALALNHVSKQDRRNLVWWIFNEWTVGDLNAASIAIHKMPEEFREQAANAIMWRSDGLSADQRSELARRIGPTDSWIDQIVDSIRSETHKDKPREAYYDRIRDPSRSRERNDELIEIARYWFELEGVGVLTEIYDSLENEDVRRSVLNNLIWQAIEVDNVSPVALLQIVSEFPSQYVVQYTTVTVFQSWGNVDHRAAFNAALAYDEQVVSDHLRSRFLTRWANVDAAGLYEEAATLPHQFQGIAIANALDQISRDSPEEAIRLAQNLGTRALRTAARNAIVVRWRLYDAKSAFEWLMNNDLDANVPRDKFLWRSTFAKYLNQDYASARSYLDQYEGELKEQLSEATAQHLFTTDIELAMAYMKSAEPKISEPILHQIAHSLRIFDPMEALSFGETLEQHEKEVYYEDLLDGWSFNNFNSLHENIHRVPKKYQPLAASRLLDKNAEKHYLTDQEIKKLESMAEEGK